MSRPSPPRLIVTNRRIEITAIEYGDTVVTVTSRFVGDERLSSEVRPLPYVTSILGGPLSGRSWTGRTWGKTLDNHMRAVSAVAEALTEQD